MKELFRRFLEISARTTHKSMEERMKNGTLGLGEYLYLIANGLWFFFCLFVVSITVVPFYFLFIRPYGQLKKKIAERLNRTRVGIPGNS